MRVGIKALGSGRWKRWPVSASYRFSISSVCIGIVFLTEAKQQGNQCVRLLFEQFVLYCS
jgi:hypothetical protein